MSNYRLIAPFYDLLLSPFLADIRRHIAAIVKESSPKKILDVCCGTGDQLRILKEEGFNVMGIDLSDAMLKIAAKGADPPDCRLQDAANMNFPDNAFDFAIITLALHEMPWANAEKILVEVHRVLSPGGKLLIVDYDLSERSGGSARRIIRLIEFIAGGDHYRNFKYYNSRGGLEKLVDKKRFVSIKDKHRASKSIILRLMQKQKQENKTQEK